MRSPLAEALGALARALKKLGVRWYLFGAQAALLYGAARLTADVDATVMLGGADTAALVQILERSGFKLRVGNVDEFVARTRVVPLLHEKARMPVDLVLAGPGIEQLFLKRRRRRMIEGVSIPVASPEDIIVMKVLAGRAKDEDDVVAILAAQRKLNFDRIAGTIATLEQALDQGDLRPRFENLRRRAARRSNAT